MYVGASFPLSVSSTYTLADLKPTSTFYRNLQIKEIFRFCESVQTELLDIFVVCTNLHEVAIGGILDGSLEDRCSLVTESAT